jgi:hypothetical protein
MKAQVLLRVQESGAVAERPADPAGNLRTGRFAHQRRTVEQHDRLVEALVAAVPAEG